MGIGIYIIYPVFFSDISSIWHASKHEKIIANLAGIFMQMWFIPLFFFYSKWSGNQFFFDFSRMLVFICIMQILPFVRSDGYWLLSDLFNIHNLLDKSQQNFRAFLNAPISFIRLSSNKDKFTLVYGIINTAFIIIFAYYQLRFNYKALLDFPIYFYRFLLQIFEGNFTNLKFETQYVLVIVFYYLCNLPQKQDHLKI